MQHTPLILSLTLLTGVLAGWLLKPGETARTTPVHAEHAAPQKLQNKGTSPGLERAKRAEVGPSAPPLTEAEQPGPADERRQQVLHGIEMQMIGWGGFSDGDIELAPEDMKAYFEALEGRAGLYGLSERDLEIMAHFLPQWYQYAPGLAMEWIRGRSSQQESMKLLSTLITGLAPDHLGEALELAVLNDQEMSAAGTMQFRMGTSLYRAAIENDMDAFVRVARLNISTSNSTRHPGFDYPEGFDFSGALNGLADVTESLENNQVLLVAPGDLLSDWAQRDPQAAFDWLLQGRKVAENDTFEDFLEGYVNVADNAALTEFVVQNENQISLPNTMWNLIRKNPTIDLIDVLLNHPGIVPRQEDVLNDMLIASNTYGGNVSDNARYLILYALDADGRLRALGQNSSIRLEHRQHIGPLLRRLGHNEQEIAIMTGSAD